MPFTFQAVQGKCRGVAAAGCCLFAGLLAWSPVTADNDKANFEVRSAYAVQENGVYFLNGRIHYQLNDAARKALENGAKLRFKLKIELTRQRRFMPDAEIASLRQRYDLNFHSLTDNYLVRNKNSGEQRSFRDLASALDHIGRIYMLPLIDASLLDDGKRYEVALRAVLDIREIPAPLRWVSFWWDDTRVNSEWYVWPLQP